MSYSKFDFSLAVDKLKIDWIRPKRRLELYQNLIQEFPKSSQLSPSEEFQKDLNFALDFYQNTAVHPEKMLDSLFIWQFLHEVWKNHNNLQIWQEMALDADITQDLVGKPDYFATIKSPFPKAPYLLIVDVCREDFDQGWGQTLAAMRGGQILNEKAGLKNVAIYGIVTSGIFWQFGKLQEDKFAMYPEGFISVFDTSQPIERILGILNKIFSESDKIADSQSK